MKAKLVIEMPYNCWECQFMRPTLSGIGYVCVAKEKGLPECYCDGSKTKPDWCPLIPVEEESILKVLDDIDEIIRIGEGK